LKLIHEQKNLLEQSQSLAEELRRTNEELQDKAHLLVKQKEEVEEKNIKRWKKQEVTGRKSRAAAAYI
jgi:GTPase involved in cell partitioning and DNA repair